MTPAERADVILAAITAVGVPGLIMLWRIARWATRIETRLADLVRTVGKHAEANDREHKEMDKRVTGIERAELESYRGQVARDGRRNPYGPAGRRLT